MLIWTLISIGSSCARSFHYTVTPDDGVSIQWGIGGDDYDYDNYDYGYEDDDSYNYSYDDDWDDDWDDYDHDWDDWDDS